MRKAYVRELKPYSIAGLAGEFGMDVGRTLHTIEELMVRGIVRYRTEKSANGADSSDEEGAKDDERYQFNFVGMAMIGDLVVIAYPKYFRDGNRHSMHCDGLCAFSSVMPAGQAWLR